MQNALDANKLKNALNAPVELHVLESCASTNDLAKTHAFSDGKLPAIFIAREQTAGRGRFTRTFSCAKDCGLYFTYVFSVPTSQLIVNTLTPAAAVAVCQAIKELSGVQCAVKWVNDIYLSGKKLAGILTEARAQQERSVVAVGVGINMVNGEHLAALPQATALNLYCSALPERELLAAQIVNYFNDLRNDSLLMSYYRELNLLLGRRVEYEYCGERYVGTAVEINDSGNLVVSFQGEQHILTANDISVRLAEDS